MIDLLAAALLIAWLVSRRHRTEVVYRPVGTYYCAVHDGHFQVPGMEPYQECPQCRGRIAEMEREFA